MRLDLPDAVARIAARLLGAGHAAYLVGGAVRDALLNRTPHDHDLATDARPEQVMALFPRAKGDDVAFGRVLVGDVDVLTLRRESQYKDRRRPSQVVFTRSVRADLARRDFTVNAMAVDLGAAGISGPTAAQVDEALVDPFGGRRDLELGVLRTVGRPAARFSEDALRVLRAVRFRSELGFGYHPALAGALRDCAPLLAHLSSERVRDEMSRLLVAPGCGPGLRDLVRYGLLQAVLPECVPMVGCAQHNPMHVHDVWEHSVRAAEAIRGHLHLRWAALLHDVAKPACRTFETLPDGSLRTHFFGHEIRGADMAKAVLRRLRYPDGFAVRVSALVRHHMFSYGPDTKAGAARRLILALSAGGVFDLLELRRADRHGSRWPSGYGRDGERLLFQVRAIADARERFTLHDLAVNGRDVMDALGIAPGPEVGATLRRLHQWVLDDQAANTREALLARLATAAGEPAGTPAGAFPEPEAAGTGDEGGHAEGDASVSEPAPTSARSR